MTVTYGFYNSLGGDRKYNARQMSSIFDGIINDGVFMSIGTSLTVTPGTGLTVVVGAGRAWFNSTWTDNDAPLVLTIDNPEPVLKRIDVVIIEVDETESVRENTFKVLKGTPATSPVAPTLTNNELVHQYPLAQILVLPGLTTFTAAHITNKVGTLACPYITGILETTSIESMVSQWEAEFGAWFDEMKDQLSTDAAGNLQLQIDAVEEVNTNQQTSIDNVIDTRPDYVRHVSGPNLGNPTQTTYVLSDMQIQTGNFAIRVPAGQQSIEVQVPFPVLFASAPRIVIATPGHTGSMADTQSKGFTVAIPYNYGVSLSGFSIYVCRPEGQSTSLESTICHVNWLAIGSRAA